jgi:hydroxymethylpyrimidine/phosphomethylpyrimidine kinase
MSKASRTLMDGQKDIPVVMAFAGHDPTGGAGITADIEAAISMGCHVAPVVTAVTSQSTHGVIGYTRLEATLLVEQARPVLEDMSVKAFKIGMLGSTHVAEALHTLLRDYPDVPVVLDPVLNAGNGTPLADEAIRAAMIDLLFPLTTVLTPNSREARLLASRADTLEACAQEIMEQGCEFVLITDAHEQTPQVINTLHSNRRQLESFAWARLPGSYHGSGCTLSSAIAGLLAQGMEPYSAIREAQEYTWECLKYGYRVGSGQLLPNRLFWARTNESQ